MSRVYYGWRIVAVAFLTHCLTTGIVFYAFGVLLSSLTEHFGWSRAEVSFGFSLVSLCGAVYSPLVAFLGVLVAVALAMGCIGGLRPHTPPRAA